MKTLFFCNLIPLKTGAFEALLASIGREFKQAGNEFTVVFAGEPISPVADALRAAGIQWLIMPEWASGPGMERAWGFVLPALRLIRQEQPDVVAVHFGNEMPTLVASLLSRILMRRAPRWVWEQDQQIQNPGWISKWFSKIRLLGLSVDRYVAVYEGGRESMIKRGIPAGKITVIYNSIAPYAPAKPKGWLREEFGVSPSDVILVTTGSLIPRKRIDFILRACAALRKHEEKVSEQKNEEHAKEENALVSAKGGGGNYASRFSVQIASGVGWKLLVIGEGPERERLGALADEFGIADRVHFLATRNDVREILADADLLVHASLAETCTYAVTEAMAAGIPVVMTVAGAAQEQIVTGRTGYVLERDDSQGFVERLAELANSRASRLAMGQAARERWTERYRVEVAAGKFSELYSSLSRQ